MHKILYSYRIHGIHKKLSIVLSLGAISWIALWQSHVIIMSISKAELNLGSMSSIVLYQISYYNGAGYNEFVVYLPTCSSLAQLIGGQFFIHDYINEIILHLLRANFVWCADVLVSWWAELIEIRKLIYWSPVSTECLFTFWIIVIDCSYVYMFIWRYMFCFWCVVERRYIELFLHSDDNSGYSGGNSYGGGSTDQFILI